MTPAAPLRVPTPTVVPGVLSAAPRRFELPRGTVTIGRDQANSVVLGHPQVSRFHASIACDGAGWTITDLHSSNGTFLNDAPLGETVRLRAGDMIRISDYVFAYQEREGAAPVLELFSEEGNARLDAVGLTRLVPPHDTPILRGVSLSIRPRELVAVVGTSGAGKSTLVNALSGFRPADRGTVLLNGVDLYRNLQTLRETLGYVPQDDIIHAELPVYRALLYAAFLRLPEDTARDEMEARIEQVLADLQLTDRRHMAISRLSGGQRKRVSIGVELLTRPRLFFLDEPTSGLDPGLETEMMKTFRHLSDAGHTLILITHATTNIHLCDQVVFLVRGGYLAYFGAPAGALRYFQANDFPAIYARLEAEEPAEWEQRYRASPEYRRMVVERLREIPAALLPPAARRVVVDGGALGRSSRYSSQVESVGSTSLPERFRFGRGGVPAYSRPRPGPVAAMREWLRAQAALKSARRTDLLRQFFVLARRYAEITMRDFRNLLLMLAQAPIIAGLLAAVFEPDIFDLRNGNYLQARTLLFLMVCCCIWFGTSNAAREICKELSVYRRERSANLKITPYVFSKLAVLACLCVVQSITMMAVVFSRVRLPDLGMVLLEKMFLVLFLASLGGLAMGLLLSAIVTNPDKAGSLVPIVLIPQIVMAGALIPLQGVSRDLGYLTVSKWAFEMLGKSIRLQELPFPAGAFLDVPPEYAYQISFAGHFWVLVGAIGTLLALTCLAMLWKDRVEG